MKWKIFCVAALLGACNLSDPESGPADNNQNNENNVNNTNNDNNTNNANNAECDPACVNGACNVDVCECDTGYTGAACDTCDADFQDNDGDGVCEATCATVDCGNGTCDDASGQAVCTCNEGYVGDACDMCDVGYQDNDADGTCEVDCATAALDCSPDGTCDDASGTAACVCPLGTEGDDGRECEIEVPDTFEGWTAYGEASVNANAATFTRMANCDVVSGVSGSYELASLDEIGPLKARVSYETELENCSGGFCSPGASPPAIRINDQAFDDLGSAFSPGGPQTVDFCLGDAYYGTVNMDIFPRQSPLSSSCDFDYQGLGQITDLEFTRSDPMSYECPRRGFATNHDFEGPDNGDAIPGWSVQGSGTGEILEEGNNKVMHLRVTGLCQSLAATSQVNVPLSDQPQALRFKYRATGAPNVSVQVGGTNYLLPDRNLVNDFEVCLPSNSSGIVEDIVVRLNSPGGLCANMLVRETFIDDIEVVDSAGCAAQDGIVNGTFDDGGFSWIPNFSVVNGNPSTIEYTNFGGENVVRITSHNECSGPSISQPIYVPRDGSKNAVELTYQLQSTAKARASIRLNGRNYFGNVNADLPETGAATSTDVFCIPKEGWGFPSNLTLSLGVRGGGGCANPQPVPLTVADVKVIADANCD